MRGRTEYSERVEGNRGNHNFGARFDMSDGYLGITQFDGDAIPDRVLLSPRQVQELLAFIDKMKTRRAA